MTPLVRSPAYVAAFLVVLGVPQLAALGEQFREGYRPFRRAPGRVALSWDMFSTAISRCDVQWEPPLDLGPRTLGRLHDSGRTLEWDPVYDTVEDYGLAARYVCAQTAAPPTTVASLRCFTNDGAAVRDAFPCR